jgi:hypothetical protein
MKKLENLGKKLSKDEQKKIIGGSFGGGGDDSGQCGSACDAHCHKDCNGQSTMGNVV